MDRKGKGGGDRTERHDVLTQSIERLRAVTVGAEDAPAITFAPVEPPEAPEEGTRNRGA